MSTVNRNINEINSLHSVDTEIGSFNSNNAMEYNNNREQQQEEEIEETPLQQTKSQINDLIKSFTHEQDSNEKEENENYKNY